MSKVEVKIANNSEIKFGDLFMWSDDSRFGKNVVMYCFNILVSLSTPEKTWSNPSMNDFIENHIRSGDLIKLPLGSSVTITQE